MSLRAMPADEFLHGICELFEQRQDAMGDGSRNGLADMKSRQCIDCGRPTRVKRCPRCWQLEQYRVDARRKERKKVQHGTTFHVAGMPVEESLQ